MKGLSLTQPWATLVAIGAKTIETRGWSTDYRGEILIASSKKFPRECDVLCWKEPFRSALIDAGLDTSRDLPLGVIVAVATLDVVLPVEDVLRGWGSLIVKHGADAARWASATRLATTAATGRATGGGGAKR